MTREGTSFDDFEKSYQGNISESEKQIYDEKRVRFAIANQIMELRKSLNLTQADLAIRSGVSQPEISRIENGMISPTVGTLGKLAVGLKSRIGFIADTDEFPRTV